LPAKKIGTQHMIEEDDIVGIAPDTLPLPAFLQRTSTGEPMPDVVAAIRRSRQGH